MLLSKKRYFILLFIFLLVKTAYADVIVNPTSWDLVIQPGGSSSRNFIFAQTTPNTTTSIALTKIGTNSDYLSFNITTGSISNINDTQTNLSLKATITVPSSASTGVSSMKIKYDSAEIPIVLTVQENTTEITIGKCRLEPFPDSYTIPFVAGSPPLTQSFSILVSRHCTEEVNIKTPAIIGNTQTKDGLRPLNLIGGSKLGFIEPNKEGNFDVQIDSSNLPSGTYKPFILVNGNYKGETLQTRISFTVEVRHGATPLEGASILPTYIFSASDLSLNNTYTITAQNLNPNFQPFVEQNEYIRGVKVDISAGWTYHFQPIKVGNTRLRVSTYFSGAPIGDITEKEIRIAYGSATSFGTRMCFQIFTPDNKALDDLAGGSTLTILVRSSNDANVVCSSNNTENTIINAVDLYKNGIKLSTNSFTINAGEIITLTASAPGFISIDKILDVPLNPVSVSFQSPNNEIEAGIPLLIITNPTDASVTVNGEVVSKNYTFQNEGVVNIVASKSGYKLNSFDTTVTQQLQIITPEIPKRIKADEPYYVELNKPASWRVAYLEKKNSTEFAYKEGFAKTIEFVPDRNGIYKVFLRDNLLKEYKIGGLFGLTIPKWFWYGVGTIIVLFFGYKMFTSRGGGTEEKGGAKYEFNTDEFGRE